eukprot:446725-Prymnesium_polylepis.1
MCVSLIAPSAALGSRCEVKSRAVFGVGGGRSRRGRRGSQDATHVHVGAGYGCFGAQTMRVLVSRPLRGGI